MKKIIFSLCLIFAVQGVTADTLTPEEEQKGYILMSALDLLAFKHIPLENIGVLNTHSDLENGEITGNEVIVYLNNQGECRKYDKNNMPNTIECSNQEIADFAVQRDEYKRNKESGSVFDIFK